MQHWLIFHGNTINFFFCFYEFLFSYLFVQFNIFWAWIFKNCFRSYDGRLLLASSSDGYCTIVTFEEGELGVPYVNDVTHNNTFDDSEVTTMEISSEYSFNNSVNCYSQVGRELSLEVNEAENKKEPSASKKYEPEAPAIENIEEEETAKDSSLLDVDTENKDESKIKESNIALLQ